MRKWLRQKGQTVSGLLGADGSRSEMKDENLPEKPTQSEIILYRTENGKSRIEVRLEDKTVWLSQRLIAELFQVAVPTINEHVKNIYAEGELERGATIRNFRIVQQEGARQVRWDIE